MDKKDELDEDTQSYLYDKHDLAIKLIQELKKDLEGEVLLGSSKDYSFNHWG